MLKVMIAEDDLIIADFVEDALNCAGYETCGIARTVSEGVAIGWLHRPDLAIIDMQLAEGGLGTDIVAQLADLQIGILYASGNVEQIMSVVHEGSSIAKPYQINDLLRALEVVASYAIASIIPAPPFPSGFRFFNEKAVLVAQGGLVATSGLP